jgi:hypothetical protein
MDKSNFSAKGQALIDLYAEMAKDGYDRTDGTRVAEAFSDFELRPYRESIAKLFEQQGIKTVLDYGCGGSDWEQAGFDKPDKSDESGKSAKDYFALDAAYGYDPARDRDERQKVDCVVSFDVLEHIFISDVPAVLCDMFSYAGKLAVLNVDCYPAAAKLPNGENAHITVRAPLWWKGMVDSIAVEYPDILICLICSKGWRQSTAFPNWSGDMWQNNKTFVVEY